MSAVEREQPEQSARGLAAVAIGATGASVAVTAAVGFLGPSAAVPLFPAAAPFPPWFVQANLSPTLISFAIWGAVLLGSPSIEDCPQPRAGITFIGALPTPEI